jgi:hypothetical protein
LLMDDQANVAQSEEDNPLTFHASLYGIAEKYQCPSLKEASQNAYIRALHGNFSIVDFISSIKVVYETTPEAERGLCKWAVFVSQGYKEMLQPHPSFKSLFMCRPDFTWDLVTAYMERRRFWCLSCKADTYPEGLGCICGNSGMCWANDRCSEEDYDYLWCPQCEQSDVVKPCGLAAACDNARSYFESEPVDKALRKAVERMED